MAATRSNESERDAANGDSLATASFVRLVTAPTAEAIAACGMISRSLQSARVPFHASITVAAQATCENATTVSIGHSPSLAADHCLGPGHAVAEASDLLRDQGLEAEPGLQIGRVLGPTDEKRGSGRSDSREAGLGMAVPELVDGLAHSSLVHGPYSGDPALAREFLDGIDAEDPQHVASAVALGTMADTAQSSRAGWALSRFLGPRHTPEGPFETAAGTADVFDLLAPVDPGLALSIACGDTGARERALGTWRRQSTALHDRLANASVESHSGVAVVQTDIDSVEPLARLVLDYLAPEASVAVVSDRRLGIATIQPGGLDIATGLEDHVEDLVQHGPHRCGATITSSPERAIDAVVEMMA